MLGSKLFISYIYVICTVFPLLKYVLFALLKYVLFPSDIYCMNNEIVYGCK